VIDTDFNKNVFINCPFDKDFEPLLQAILFCVVYHGFTPRLSLESSDSSENRLTKITRLIEQSRYSIHDLSRCEAATEGEIFRLNMPFELGIDFAYRKYGGVQANTKKLLILEKEKYRYQAALSDISGCDIVAHDNDFEKIVKVVRSWLKTEASAPIHGPSEILGAYITFQEWYIEQKISQGFSKDDLYDYPTKELLDEMFEWKKLGEPY